MRGSARTAGLQGLLLGGLRVGSVGRRLDDDAVGDHRVARNQADEHNASTLSLTFLLLSAQQIGLFP